MSGNAHVTVKRYGRDVGSNKISIVFRKVAVVSDDFSNDTELIPHFRCVLL